MPPINPILIKKAEKKNLLGVGIKKVNRVMRLLCNIAQPAVDNTKAYVQKAWDESKE